MQGVFAGDLVNTMAGVFELDEGKRFEGKIARRVWLVYLFW